MQRAASARNPNVGGRQSPRQLSAPLAPTGHAASVDVRHGHGVLCGELAPRITTPSTDNTPKSVPGGLTFPSAPQHPGAWEAYDSVLRKHPLMTKCCTSLAGFMLGDVIAQLCTTSGFDPLRCAIIASYGFFVDAPAGNAFYAWLDATISPAQPKAPHAVATKIVIDQLIYAPIFTCVLYAYLTALHGDFASIPAVLQEKLVPTLLANYAIWPLAHGLNFYFVPLEQRILYNNFVGVCWTTWLSLLAH